MQKAILTVASLLSLLIAPAPAFALFSVNQGGTGQTFFTAGSLIYGNGTNPLATTTPGTLGYVLQFNGTFPTWVSTSTLHLAGGSNGSIQFNNGGALAGDNKLTWDGNSALFLGPLPFPNTTGIRIVSNNSEIDFGAVAGGFDKTIIAENDGLYLQGPSTTAVQIAGPSAPGSANLDVHTLTVNRQFTFPDASGTFGLLEANQTWTGNNTFSKGAGTTTVNFGTIGDSTSHTCFNTKTSNGQDMSFYFNNDFQMVIEQNSCQ